MENVKKPKHGFKPRGKNKPQPTPAKEKQTYCILCRKMYWTHDAQEHMHSLLHHQELGTVVGIGAFHECHACKVSAMGLDEYGQHILTAQHEANLQCLKSKNIKAISLHKTLSAETINRIVERNKQIKTVEKKAMKKKRKKLKQVAAKQLAGEQQKIGIITAPAASGARKSNQEQAGINTAVVQNKENKRSGVQRPFSLPEPFPMVESETFDPWSDEAPHQPSFGYHSLQYNSTQEKDFTDDQLPQSGAIIFGRSSQSPQPTQESSETSARPAALSKPANDEPLRDVNISSMLRHIRRVLGVREPCRAEREARKLSVTQRSAMNQPAYMSAAPAPTSLFAQSKQTASDGTPEQTRDAQENSGAAVTVSQADSERMLYNSGKVRIAHKPGKGHVNTDAKLKPTLDKLLRLSGARSKLNWSQMSSDLRKKQMKGMHRFGLEMMKHPADQQSSTQSEDLDSPLSEGFHWESLPGSPLDLLPPPEGAADADDPTEEEEEEEEDSHAVGHMEPPASAQPSFSSRTAAGLMVKMESGFGDEEFSDSSRPAKRRCDTGADGVDSENVSKRKKSNRGQDQMDQLLTVSLREEELSHTLQDLDSSLIQARDALQAAYMEVQRIVLLKQQCAVEVNRLRARRIEILQNMQGELSGSSHPPETASSSSAAVQPPSFPPPDGVPVPSSQLSPAAAPPSPVGPLQLQPSAASLSIKKEMCNLPTATPPSRSADGDPLPDVAADGSSYANAPPTTEPSAGQEEQEILEEAEDCGEAVPAEEPRPERSDAGEETEGIFSTENVVVETEPEEEESKEDRGNESDNSVEVIHSKTEIIAIEESDYEDLPEAKPDGPDGTDEPLQPGGVELSSAGTQTAQQADADSKADLIAAKAEDGETPEVSESAEDEQPSVGPFLNHTGPVNSLQVHDGLLYTCSGDNTARAYCLATRECKAVFEGHTNKINCLLVSSLPNMPTRLYTGASDQMIRAFSIKSKKCLEQIFLPDRVLCFHIAWNILYAGLANGSVFSYDLKTLKELDVFECHGPRGVSCLGTAQEGARRLLLVGSYDSTISVRDAKSGLLLRSLEGHTKTVLCLKVVNDLVFSGSSDTSVHAHNIHTGELVRIYKGHGHAVTAIVILGKVMVTACLDKLVRVYELQSHDRLQVYGGHSDMVMCMTVHKSVIYTGCYDGGVQAVKLNLMKNHRCWWQNCSLIFGIPEHLAQHLAGDHSNPNLQMMKCRWRGCSTYFATQQLIREKLPEHMQKHVEEDSSMQQ
ncbi:uncharacterized protein LOC115401359 [Salarias fasciatus]|uniref:Uncharacterized LOC115401359 n=1 Tax=Salarias fasciatus TaxID=181472 RepID=A0A672GS07_SALFA|nr:uncharacterized protein LOC115401359 [Salarias fasciatus]